MSRLNIWFPVYPADFSIDTAHLTSEQVGAYVRLLCRLWRQSGRIKNDDSELARIVGVSPQKWRRMKASIEPLFNTADPASWCSDWLNAELEKAKHNSDAKRKNAQSRWRKDNDNPMQMHSGSSANASDEPMQMQ